MKLAKGFLEKIIPFIIKDTYIEHFNNADDFSNSMISSLEYGLSVTWCLGGNYGTCWDNDLRTVSAEVEPELNQLDDLLMVSYPQTSFMQFRKINQCISVSEYGDSDYYGGRTNHATKTLDFSELSKTLVELGLEIESEAIDVKDFCKEWFKENLQNSVHIKKNKKIK